MDAPERLHEPAARGNEIVKEAAKKPGVERVDEHTVQCVVDRQCDVLKWITGTGLP